MNRLRIAMLTTFYPPCNFGGDGIGVQRLSRGLARLGVEVHVIHDAGAYRLLTGSSAPPHADEIDGITVHRIDSRHPLLQNLVTQQTGRPGLKRNAIRDVLDTHTFDVINYHNVSLLGGPGLFALGSGLKLHMAHEHWLVCESHVLWRHGRELCTRRECFRCVLRHRRPPQLWRRTGLLERMSRHVDAFIAMSEFSRAKHRELGFPRDMEVLPYFLPDRIEEAHAGDAPHHGARPYFLFVGRLERIKGLDEVIPLFRDIDADLLIAGEGEYGSVLKDLARDVENVRFLGRLPHEELVGYYRGARALIVPSVCYETFGIILIEAFREGTPVIARRLGPFPEIVEASGAGLLFSTGDELRSALDRFLGEPELRDKLGRAGQESFDAHWSESVVVPRYLELIARTATRKGEHELAERARVHAKERIPT